MKQNLIPFRKCFPAGLAGLFLFLVLPISAAAQSFSADYDRAFSLRQRTADLVYRAEIKPHWLADCHRFWYRVQTGPQTREFILVDAETGARQPAFDHDRLARSLTKATSRRMRADNLPLNDLDFPGTNILRFTAAGKTWRCNLENYSLAMETNAATRESSVRRLPAPRPSLRTGPETSLHFINRTTNDATLFWVDPAGDRQAYGIIPAGGEREQNTYAGHVWLVTTDAGNQLAVFEAPEDGGDAIIGGDQPPARENFRRNPGRDRQRDGAISPDGNWSAFIRDENVFLRNVQTGNELALSTNGTAADFYDEILIQRDGQSILIPMSPTSAR